MKTAFLRAIRWSAVFFGIPALIFAFGNIICMSIPSFAEGNPSRADIFFIISSLAMAGIAVAAIISLPVGFFIFYRSMKKQVED